MNKNDFINFKFFSSIYLKLKENRVNSMDEKISVLKKKIETEEELLQKNNIYFDKLIEENTSIKKEYYNLLELFENENKTISVRNNNYNISIWENVYIRKKSSFYVIEAKREVEGIYTFDKNMNDFIDYFSTLDYSIIVLSISKKRIILQLMLHKN